MASASSGSKLRLSSREFFYLEQWTAFLIGAACLVVSGWAALQDYQSLPAAHHLRFIEAVRPVMKWSLTIAVSLLGTALIRFAFSKPGADNCDAPSIPKTTSAAKDKAREASDGKKLVANAGGSR